MLFPANRKPDIPSCPARQSIAQGHLLTNNTGVSVNASTRVLVRTISMQAVVLAPNQSTSIAPFLNITTVNIATIDRGSRGNATVQLFATGGPDAMADVVANNTELCQLVGFSPPEPSGGNRSVYTYNCTNMPLGRTTVVFTASKGGACVWKEDLS